jgi:hypothetical protein
MNVQIPILSHGTGPVYTGDDDYEQSGDEDDEDEEDVEIDEDDGDTGEYENSDGDDQTNRNVIILNEIVQQKHDSGQKGEPPMSMKTESYGFVNGGIESIQL